ncbi:hypothetical protein [Myxococcus qinghaiensis]|uniref:hypothetical protein n=1 Tax=Myxococcus qinghaiensis TaxID=2906758 RepID=UPI0020A7A50B|nr:hypothetical protein [Myxococcus qinghaiensis]MCP3162298.1 hypothetical protein [Myxococcus qinghaiensis]
MSRKPMSLLLSFALCLMPVAVLAEESTQAQEAPFVVSGETLVSHEESESQQSEDVSLLSTCYWQTTVCTNKACPTGGAEGTHLYYCYYANGDFEGSRTVSTCCGAVSPQ